MASSGREWAEIIAYNNSGTYNNQYMVIDLKLFSPGQELQPDLLWVIEQASMFTETLLTGYGSPGGPQATRRWIGEHC